MGIKKKVLQSLNDWQEQMIAEADKLKSELGVSHQCALDVLYLRTRARHTPELEGQLIALHKVGSPPDIIQFGVTK